MATKHELSIMSSDEWSTKQQTHVKYAKSVGEQRYPFIVICSCQWQSFAPSVEYAEIVANEHVRTHQLMGPTSVPMGHL